MALQRLTLATATLDADTDAVPNGDDGSKAPRLPRWTRQEILVLIQGKKVAENRVRRGRAAGLAFGSGQVEPKWASVSSYCKRHGVNRGPVQCRKRWSNLAGDYKKIKEWESQIREESESFWVMRNDLRRERRLPGFFDREVYDILDGGSDVGSSGVLALALAPTTAAEGEEAEGEAEPVFDSGRSAAADDGLFSDGQEEVGGSPDVEPQIKMKPSPLPTPVSEKQDQPFSQGCAAQGSSGEKQHNSNPDIGTTTAMTTSGEDGRKRKRSDGGGGMEETESMQQKLVETLERNGRMLGSHLEAHNSNLELDREQRKEHVNGLICVLNKFADALGRIADKL